MTGIEALPAFATTGATRSGSVMVVFCDVVMVELSKTSLAAGDTDLLLVVVVVVVIVVVVVVVCYMPLATRPKGETTIPE